ncbi:YfhO family protein [Patescibacteria group bacterium]|nr:YfhO family protein [Patescibacteria group bacterium]
MPTLAMFDNYSLMMPIKLFQARWIRQGIIPLWNPLLFSGISLIGDINQSLFYPSTLLFVLFKPALALNLTLLIHLFITGLGMFHLAKQFVKKGRWAVLAGILWMLSAQVTNSLNNLSILQSLAWTPWVIWLGLLLSKNKKAQWWLPIIITLQLLGGYPQHVLYAVLGALFLSGFKKKIQWQIWLKNWLLVGITSILLSSFVWLPFVETLVSSTRVVQTQIQSVSGSLHPIELIKLIVPTFFDNLRLGLRWGPKWNQTPYLAWYMGWLGILVPIVVTFSKKRTKLDMWLAGGVLFTLWFALGEYAPGFRLLQRAIPILKISRIPTTILGVGTILMILWLVTSLPRLKMKKNFFIVLISSGLIATATASIGYILSKYYPQTLWELLNKLTNNALFQSTFHTLERDALIVQSITRSLIFSSIFFVLALWMWQQKNWKFLILFLTIDVFISAQGLLIFAPNDVYPKKFNVTSRQIFSNFYLSPQERILTRNLNHPYADFAAYWEAVSVRQPFSDSYITDQDLKDFSHLNRYQQGLTPDWNLVAGVPIVNGYSTLLPKDYVQLWTDESSINQLPQINLDNQLLSDWAVKYYLVDTWFSPQEDLSQYPLIAEHEQWQLYELPALPRFRYGDTSAIELENFSETPNEVSFVFENQDNHHHHQQLIMADRYDTNWRAEINGQQVTLQNHQEMRMIEIEPGQNSIRFFYSPKWVYLGQMISSLTVFCGGAWLLIKRK